MHKHTETSYHVINILCTICVKQTNTTSSTREPWRHNMSAGNTDGHGARGSLQTATPLHHGAVPHRPEEHTACHPPFSSTDSSDSSTEGAALLYATGCMQKDVGNLHGISQPSASQSIIGVSAAIACVARGQELYFCPTIKPHQTYAGFWGGG